MPLPEYDVVPVGDLTPADPDYEEPDPSGIPADAGVDIVRTAVPNEAAADCLPELVKNSLVACIGPVTAATAKELGFTVGVMAKEYTIPGLTAAMEKYYSEKKEADG